MIFNSYYHCIEIRKDDFKEVETIIKENNEPIAIEKLKEVLKSKVFSKSESILDRLAKNLYKDYMNGTLAKHKVGFFGN